MYAIKRKALDGLLELVRIGSMHMETPTMDEAEYPENLRQASGYGHGRSPIKPPRGYDKWDQDRKWTWLQKFTKQRERVRAAWLKQQPPEAMRFSMGYGVAPSTGKTLAPRVRFLRPADQRKFDAIEAQIKRLHVQRTNLIGAAFKRGKIVKAADLVAAISAEERRQKAANAKRSPYSDYEYRHHGDGLDHTDEFMPPEQRAINAVKAKEKAERDRIKAEAQRKVYEAERKAREKLKVRLATAHAKGSHAKKQPDECDECRKDKWEAQAQASRDATAKWQAEHAAGPELRSVEGDPVVCLDCGHRFMLTDENDEFCDECGSDNIEDVDPAALAGEDEEATAA